MKIYDDLEKYQPHEAGAYVALGFFDGVHAGHRAVISNCAKDNGKRPCTGPCVALTFRENPAKALGRAVPPMISNNRQKAALLESAGADEVIFADFEAIKDLSPSDFVRKILRDTLNAKRVYCGFNYHFGQNGSGDIEALKELCAAEGIGVCVQEPVYLDGEQVSSSLIRQRIAEGNIERANELLGYRYALFGDIGSGNHIGSVMGFPTVNIPIDSGAAVPQYGVYASTVIIDSKRYLGATNIGVHPTVGANSEPLCESFLLDFEGGDLYGQHAACELIAFIREERRFASTEELSAQIRRDCEAIRILISE